LSGCGGAATVVDRDGTLQLTLDEYRIAPARIQVRPGRVHIVARNRGVLTHNVVVELLPRSGEVAPREVGRTRTAHPGQTVSVDVVLAPGTYRLVCTIANHENLGQYATLSARSS
jgi:plastocyanin